MEQGMESKEERKREQRELKDGKQKTDRNKETHIHTVMYRPGRPSTCSFIQQPVCISASQPASR